MTTQIMAKFECEKEGVTYTVTEQRTNELSPDLVFTDERVICYVNGIVFHRTKPNFHSTDYVMTLSSYAFSPTGGS